MKMPTMPVRVPIKTAMTLRVRVQPFLAMVWGFGLAGCDIAQVVLAEPEPLVVAEIYLEAGQGPHRATAFLHRVLGSGSSAAVPGAKVRLLSGGAAVTLTQTADSSPCLIVNDVDVVEGTCYAADPLPEGFGRPGSTIEARVRLPDGSELVGRTAVPSEFALIVPDPGTTACLLAPGASLAVSWTSSEGAWAYLGETHVFGLAEVLAAAGSTVELQEDPLFLTGLALSAADTTLVFPSEFGVFDRFHLEQEIAVLLQAGLPRGTSAQVTIAAADRNTVNWVRGGSFNPSGSIRVPSLFGDTGTGVIGSSVRVGFDVLTVDETGLNACR
jgi:hypothetical protein